MATYIIYVARGKEGKAGESYVVKNTESAKTAKAAFRRKYPNETKIVTILKAEPNETKIKRISKKEPYLKMILKGGAKP